MELKESVILRSTISKLFPFIMLFSFYMFSYGAVYPGGGFQAGVIFGTIVVIFELVFEQRLFSNVIYKWLEFFGIILIFIAMIYSFSQTGFLFGDMYHYFSSSDVFTNVFIWVLNFAIYSEVSGSIILIFRHFIEWEYEEV